MFDKLIEIITRFWNDILPFIIVEQWNEAIHLRLGKYHRTLKAGIWIKIPFFDSIIETAVITQTVNLPAQTLTTLDEQGIVLKALIRYRVVNVKNYLLNVMHANDVLVDTTMGMIRDIVELTTWADLIDVNEQITAEVKEFVEKWGIEIEKITITDLAIVKTFRILGDDIKPLPLNEFNNG
jgi:regulator of protease activity HflC (stomatin/prohibitin superfamily)